MTTVNHRAMATIALAALVVGILTASGGWAAEAPGGGESVTMLPDGRALLLGGGAPGAARDTASIPDPRTGSVGALPGGLAIPRAWHSATLLPDGTVLVLGGVGADGAVVGTAERFDPDTGVSQIIDGVTSARAHHTATVLSDGRVLVVGGISGVGETLATAEMWNGADGPFAVLPGRLAMPRSGHRATLAADGAVIVAGGVDGDGRPVTTDERFEIDRGEFALAEHASTGDSAPLHVEASIPAPGSVGVPVDQPISIRFSRPLRADALLSADVTLVGVEGSRSVRAVPVENGRLLFLTPAAPLETSASYVLSISGAADAEGNVMPPWSLVLTTAAAAHAIRGAPAVGPAHEPVTARATARDRDDDDRAWSGEWRDGRPYSRWQALPSLNAPPGVTALAGQILRLDGEPLAGIRVSAGGVTSRTDGTGRFLLASIPPGRQQLVLDGRPDHGREPGYGVFEIGVDIDADRTNALPFTSWLPRIDARHAVALAAPTAAEVVVTSPRLPGLEVRIPRESVIRDREGGVATEISITPIPRDRPPFPLPAGVDTPAYFTIQPGGAYVSHPAHQGARVIYPNFSDQRRPPPGARFDFWHYDPDEAGWHVYGRGEVSADGQQVIPDPGVAIYEFTGAMISTTDPPPPSTAPTPGSTAWDGEPVELSTGLFVHRKTDLYLDDAVPLALTRTYRPGDPASRPFGIGSSHPYHLFLDSATPYQEADLVGPDGAKVHFVRTTPGNDIPSAVFEHTETPTAFYRATIRNGSRLGFWTMTLTDGTAYLFGENAPLERVIDAFNRIVQIDRADVNAFGAPTGNITKITSPNGRWIAFTYDALDRITQARDSIGRTVQYTYDAPGRLIAVTDPEGGITRYTYDGAHRMLTLQDPRGIVYLTNEYDGAGRVTRQTQADGTAYVFAYTLDSAGRVVRTDVTDPRGIVRRVTFDSSGRVLTDTRAAGTALEQTISYQRDAAGFVVASTDALGRRAGFTYNSLGHVTSVTRLAGTAQSATTTFGYTPGTGGAVEHLSSIADPLGHTTSFAHDSEGNPAEITDPLGARTMVVGVSGDLRFVTDPLGNTTELGYDVQHNVVSVIDPLRHVTGLGYDAARRLTSRTDPRGKTTLLVYDRLDRLTRVTDPAGGATSFEYDGNGNLVAVTDPRGGVTTYAFDSMDRLSRRGDPLQQFETYGYDAVGNLTTITDRKGQVTTITFDALNRPTEALYADGASTSYSWDAGNRLVGITDSAGGTITRTYDLHDRLTSETTSHGTVDYTYDAAGRRTAMTVAGQPTVGYAYDAASRLTRLTRGALAVDLAYDAGGRRTAASYSNGIAAEYAYDAASRVTGLTYRRGATVLGTLTSGYDAAGNRVRVGGTLARTGLPDAMPAATYDAANRMLTFAGRSLAHDPNGNTVSDGANTYEWNARDQLVGLAGAAGAASFGYDGLGRRHTKQIDGITTSFLYDGVNAVQEIGSSSTENRLVGLEVDHLLAREISGATRVPFVDALGSIIALAADTGAVQAQYTYEPFGTTTGSGPSDPNASQFTGRENDSTGLYYFRARYYHPEIQRFISEDPLGFAGGDVNLYAYARNNPTTLTDPFGLDVYVALYPTFVTHVGIGVNTTATVGFYPTSGSPLIPMGFSVAGKVKPDTLQAGKIIMIATSPMQDKLMLDAIRARADNPGTYNLYGRNCTAFAATVLRAAGIPVPSAWMPEQLIYGLPHVLNSATPPVPWTWMSPASVANDGAVLIAR